MFHDLDVQYGKYILILIIKTNLIVEHQKDCALDILVPWAFDLEPISFLGGWSPVPL